MQSRRKVLYCRENFHVWRRGYRREPYDGQACVCTMRTWRTLERARVETAEWNARIRAAHGNTNE